MANINGVNMSNAWGGKCGCEYCRTGDWQRKKGPRAAAKHKKSR